MPARFPVVPGDQHLPHDPHSVPILFLPPRIHFPWAPTKYLTSLFSGTVQPALMFLSLTCYFSNLETVRLTAHLKVPMHQHWSWVPDSSASMPPSVGILSVLIYKMFFMVNSPSIKYRFWFSRQHFGFIHLDKAYPSCLISCLWESQLLDKE